MEQLKCPNEDDIKTIKSDIKIFKDSVLGILTAVKAVRNAIYAVLGGLGVLGFESLANIIGK